MTSPTCPISVQYLGAHSDGQADAAKRRIPEHRRRLLPVRVHDASAVKEHVPHDRIAISPAAYEVICSTLPLGVPLWPVERQGGQNASSTSRRPSSTACGPCAGRERTTAT